MLYLQFPELRDLEQKKLSPDEWRDLLRRVTQDLYAMESSVPREAYMASIALLAISGYPSAKHYLVEHGRTAAEVEDMPVAQVVLLYAVKLYDELSDDQFKWFHLPSSEGGAALQRQGKNCVKPWPPSARSFPLPRSCFRRPRWQKRPRRDRNCPWPDCGSSGAAALRRRSRRPLARSLERHHRGAHPDESLR